MEPDEESRPAHLRKAKNTSLPPAFPGQLGLVGTATTPFTDHSGQKAMSVYWGRAPSSGAPILPPLWSFQFYVTFGATADSDPSLPEKLLTASTKARSDTFPIRLDINYLPGADSEKCMGHYRAEKAARLEAGAPLLVTDPYSEYGANFSFLVIVEHADWMTKGGTTILFDNDDPEGSREPVINSDSEWGDVSQQSAMSSKRSIGESLYSLRGWTPTWESGNELYDEKLEQGRSDWS
jgi:hypothetical protein